MSKRDASFCYYSERIAPVVHERFGKTFALCEVNGIWYIRQRNPVTTGVGGTSYGSEAAARCEWARMKTLPPCRECGEVDHDEWMDSAARQMAERGLCFNCNHWTNAIASVDRDTAIIGGHLYQIGEEGSTSYFRGYGGARFVIRFNDGREVITTNLWSGGEIPPHFRDRLPDNAEFLSRQQSCAYVGHGSASV